MVVHCLKARGQKCDEEAFFLNGDGETTLGLHMYYV